MVTADGAAQTIRDNDPVRVPASLQRLRDLGQVGPGASSEAARVERGLLLAFSLFRIAIAG